MNLLDSSCWLEYVSDSPLAGVIEPVIKNSKELIVPSITIYEVVKKLLLEKDQDYALNIARQMMQGTVPLWTTDQHFEKLPWMEVRRPAMGGEEAAQFPNIRYFPK
jgi:predicted nucleic acid-binding protein